MFLTKLLKRFFLMIILTFSMLNADTPINIEMLKSKKNPHDSSITLILTNTSNQEVKILTWGTPLEKTLHKNLFIIKHGKKTVPYIGKLLKRRKPTDDDYTSFEANEKRIITIKLATYYAMYSEDTYTISFNGIFHLKEGIKKKKSLKKAKSITPLLRIDYIPKEENQKKEAKLSPQFVGCSSSNKNILKSVQDEAIKISKNSWDVMKNAPSNTKGERYATWFGSPNSTRQGDVTTHFKNIYNALEN